MLNNIIKILFIIILSSFILGTCAIFGFGVYEGYVQARSVR